MITERFSIRQEHLVIEVSHVLFRNLVDQSYFTAENVLDITALSIYLASYLNGIPIPLREIASVMGVSLDEVQVIYALFYPHRKDLLENRAVWMDDNFERLVDDLPREMRILLWE